MSLKQVVLRQVVCDADDCQAVTKVTASDAVGARFQAAGDGWKYATIRKGKGPARRFDYCPSHVGEVA